MSDSDRGAWPGAWLTLTLASAVTAAALAFPQVRDAATPERTGTAVVTGVVTDGSQSPQPLRRAVVTLSGEALLLPRSAITDDGGRYVFRGLPAGRLTIAAVKRGYIAGAFGAARAGRAGTPIELRAGETLTASIQLARGAVLTGTIRDLRGAPIPGLRVFAITALRLVATPPVGADTNTFTMTDDRGVYRLYDLAPGAYVVAAVETASVAGEILRRSTEETDAALARLRARSGAGASSTLPPMPPVSEAGSLAPVYFPGTTSLKAANRVKLAPGDVREGLDFTMTAARVTTIEGIVVADRGIPSVELSISPEDSLRFFALGGANPALVQPPGADGRFKYATILPGHYVIWARAGAMVQILQGRGGGAASMSVSEQLGGRGGGATPETLYAVAELDVSGQPIAGVTLQLQRGSRLAGTVEIDASAQPVPDFTTMRVSIRPGGSLANSTVGGTRIGTSFSQIPAVPVAADGTFEIVGVPPGAYTLRVTIPPAGGRTWWPRSAVMGDRDVLDSGVAIAAGQDVSGVRLTVTDRRSEIAGTLQSAQGLPAPEYFVIVMPADPALWTAGSRRVKSTRPATDGAFSFLDLPPGEYLLAALTDVDPDEWQTAEFLGSIAPAGVRVTLGQNERVRHDLLIRR